MGGASVTPLSLEQSATCPLFCAKRATCMLVLHFLAAYTQLQRHVHASAGKTLADITV